MTRILLEVTNVDTGQTKYITVGDPPATLPDLVAHYAKSYTKALLGLDHEVMPQRMALFPGGDEETDAAA